MTDRRWRTARQPPPRRLRRHRVGQFRIPRSGTAGRRLVSGLFVVAALLLASGCTPPGLPAPIAPSAGSGTGSAPAAAAAVTIGVDGTVEGFNPHAISDYSPAEAAVAGLVLPSVSSVAADGSVRLNADLVDKAVVTSTDPFTVTYTLDRDAAWSDGTPITAEDFSYLRGQMLLQPATVDPAGYRLIGAIISRDAGKTVVVRFTHAVADWLTLFSPLLPSHILKDSPGGWTEGLATGIPVSGNRYKMQSYDTVTGEITLVRNDKYWGTQPKPTMAVLRIGAAAALIQALGRGDLQAVLVRPDAADERTLESLVPAARRVAVPLPGTVQLIFNTVAGATADLDVRRAIASGLDMQAIRSALDGGNAATDAPAQSLVTLPTTLPTTGGSSTGSPTSSPTGGGSSGNDTNAALGDLAAAGYHRESLYMSKGGRALRVTLAYSSTDARLAAAAALIQSQLAAIGIEVDLLRDGARAVVNNRLGAGTVDMGLVMVPRGSSDALAAASAFGCPLPAAQTSSPATALPRAGNLSGYCSTETQTMLGEATTGVVPAGLNAVLAAALPVLQLSRPSAIFATSAGIAPQLSGAGPGWVFSGPLGGLPDWPTS